jgi:hypothetical protein
VFAIEIDSCTRCEGRLRVIASIEEPQVMARILAHIQKTDRPTIPRARRRGRATRCSSPARVTATASRRYHPASREEARAHQR